MKKITKYYYIQFKPMELGSDWINLIGAYRSLKSAKISLNTTKSKGNFRIVKIITTKEVVGEVFK